MSPDDIDLERALDLLSLPREIGKHPEDGEPILAGVGRFGPYVQHGKTYANLDAGDDVLTVGLNRAVTLIAEKKPKPAQGPPFGADPGRSLGEHPDKGGPIVVKNGRYGPYVSHDGVNATLPADMTPETITLEQAIPLLDARAERGGGKKARRQEGPGRQEGGGRQARGRDRRRRRAERAAAAAQHRAQGAESQARRKARAGTGGRRQAGPQGQGRQGRLILAERRGRS